MAVAVVPFQDFTVLTTFPSPSYVLVVTSWLDAASCEFWVTVVVWPRSLYP